MKAPKRYASATAFRVALESRLKVLAQAEGLDLQRLRRQVAFDRLLVRLFAEPEAQWLLKGGYAMELRLNTARTTRDIDLALRRLPVASADWEANVPDVLESLREAGNQNLHDFFTFVIGSAMQDLDAAPYGGARFPVDARLAGRTFAKFHLDVSTGDVLRGPYESLSGRDWLEFAGIASATFPAVSPEEQFAEKLHAYTLPRTGREKHPCQRPGGFGSADWTRSAEHLPVAAGHSRNLPAARTDCPRRTWAVFGSGLACSNDNRIRNASRSVLKRRASKKQIPRMKRTPRA